MDFGYAAQSNELKGFAGSPHFAAPEVHAAKRSNAIYAGTPTDVWSAGVVLFAMLATCLPFSGSENSLLLQRKVALGKWDRQPQCSQEAVDLLKGMLSVRAHDRLTVDRICDHPWVVHQQDHVKPSADDDIIPWRGFDEAAPVAGAQ